ncbi:hypothetical protein GW17_00031366 [Ensete ventricosum]|nr:hypothetical protein GW17_00031366 [Ensete ventricosum]
MNVKCFGRRSYRIVSGYSTVNQVELPSASFRTFGFEIMGWEVSRSCSRADTDVGKANTQISPTLRLQEIETSDLRRAFCDRRKLQMKYTSVHLLTLFCVVCMMLITYAVPHLKLAKSIAQLVQYPPISLLPFNHAYSNQSTRAEATHACKAK